MKGRCGYLYTHKTAARILCRARPMMWIVTGMLAVLVIADTLDTGRFFFAVPLLAAASAGIFLLFLVPRLSHLSSEQPDLCAEVLRAAAWILIGVTAALLSWNMNHAYRLSRVTALDGLSAYAEGTVTDVPDDYGDDIRVRLRVDTLDGRKVRPFTVLARFSVYPDISAGDSVSVRLQFALPEESRGFDTRRYYRAEGIYLFAENLNFPSVFTPERFPLRVVPVYLAETLRERLNMLLPEEDASMAEALILGDTSALSAGTRQALRKCGVSHIAAVSGLHVGFLVSLCILIFRRRAGMWISLPLIVLYALMTGGSPSVWRAVLMQFICAGSYLFHREADPLSSLFTAWAVLLLADPFLIASVSMWLSFTATLGLFTIGLPLQEKLHRGSRKRSLFIRKCVLPVLSLLVTSFAALVFSLPVSLFFFGGVSVISPPANLLILWAAEPAFLFGFAAAVLGTFSTPLGRIAAFPARLCLGYIRFCSALLSRIPYAWIRLSVPLVLTIAAVYCTALLLAAALRFRSSDSSEKTEKRDPAETVSSIILPAARAVAACAAAAVVCACLIRDPCVYASVLDTSGGQCTVFSYRDACIVIGCGGYDSAKALTGFLDAQGIERIDILVLPSWRASDSRTAETLMRDREVGLLLASIPEEGTASRLTSLSALADSTCVVTDDTRISAGKLTLRLLPCETQDFGNGRITAYMDTGKLRFLFPGAVSSDTLSAVLCTSDLAPADIVVTGDYYGTHALPPCFTDAPPALVLTECYGGVPEETLLDLDSRGIRCSDLAQTGTVSFEIR